ncbi:hypothetical protein Micbo1qcDRAFT_225647 [Microdochium bolleyi]|uniref:Uncharacterized protein n=1 Tax=Microdochium bolleyi TaxID=196109 RepID=A0A136J0M0_9PEZI|nr:hypothetical protein Micbo1qcDRAFT_225647 [Microdochium bolleyi]
MADNLSSVRQPRAQRHTTSCGECRKRKQRPACEYKENKRKDGYPIPNTSTFLLATLQSREETDRFLSSGRDALLPISRSPISTSDAGSDLVGLETWTSSDIQATFDQSRNPGEAPENWNSARPGVLPKCSPLCHEHSVAFHDAARLLEYTSHSANEFIASLNTTASEDEINWGQLVAASAVSESSFPGIADGEAAQNLPIATEKLKADLLQVYAKLLFRFQCSIDGNPDFHGSYHKTYMPFCFQSPLLVNIAIYTAASYMHETNYLDKTMTIAIKGYAIRMLNDHLRSENTSTGDEVIAGIAQLVADEWHWGAPHDVRAHLRGLRDLLRVRGGFNALGLGGLLSKIVLTLDYSIAISFESPAYLGNGHEGAFSDPTPGPFRISHNTPLVASMVTFSDCISGLNLHPATASILDDIRFLLAAVASLPAQSSPTELKKVATTSHWIFNRISKLPIYSPDAPDPPATPQQLPTNNLQGHTGSQRNSTDSPASMAEQNADPVYQAIRQAALLYATAIVERQPFSKVVSFEQFYELWTTVWRVPLTRWKSLAGIFLWIIIIISPTAATTPHSRFVKSMLTTPALGIGIENWFASSSSLRAVLALQAWLRGGEELRDMGVGGGGGGGGGSGNAAPRGHPRSMASSVSGSSRQSSDQM